MKTKLTIEESARLIELGVDPKLASSDSFFLREEKRTEYFARIERLTGKRDFPKGVFSKIEKPYANGFSTRHLYHKIFTLTDILSIMPKEIDRKELVILNGNKTSICGYGEYDSQQGLYGKNADGVIDGIYPQIYAPELIDALNQLLIWAIEQGHLKTERK